MLQIHLLTVGKECWLSFYSVFAKWDKKNLRVEKLEFGNISMWGAKLKNKTS